MSTKRREQLSIPISSHHHVEGQGGGRSARAEGAALVIPAYVLSGGALLRRRRADRHVRLKIARTMFGTSDARPVAERLHRQKAFLSYSSSDRTEVLKRAQGMRAAQIEVFQDVLSLDPGERCKQQIFKRIDESDIFLLFWSQAARDSKWVLKEATLRPQAQEEVRVGPPEFVPVVLEGPPPVWLSHIRFNDPVCYFLAAAPREQTRPAEHRNPCGILTYRQ